MMVNTTADAQLSSELVFNYFKNLVNQFFKILPMRESEEESLPIYIDSSRGGSKIFYFHLTSTFLKRERIESLKALKCWFTGTKVEL